MDAKRRFRMATELLWFASASFGAGLLAAVAIAALVMLLSQASYAAAAESRRGALDTPGCAKLVQRLVFLGSAQPDYRRLTAISLRAKTPAGCARPTHYFARPRSTNTAFISA